MASGLNELLNIQESALRVREARQQLLASNIANADTPNYKARDVNFSAALQQVSQARQSFGGPLALSTTSGAHIAGAVASAVSGATQYRNEQQGGIDGNDVDVDKERNEFADNGLRYEATVTLITAQIHNMLAVIQS